MTARIWESALALGAVLAVSGAVRAGDTQQLGGGTATGSTTMTLGGKGTVQQAATADTELARGYHHFGGYRGWGGGYGYRGYYGGGWGGYGYRGYGGYYGGYRSFYRPYYGYGYGSYYRPYYGGYSSYPIYSSYYGGYGYGGYGCGTGFYLGISGGAGTSAPAVNLGSLFTAKPTADEPAATTQPVSGKATIGGAPAKVEYRYKAYGEK